MTVAGIIKITIFGGYEYDLSQDNLAGRHNVIGDYPKRMYLGSHSTTYPGPGRDPNAGL